MKRCKTYLAVLCLPIAIKTVHRTVDILLVTDFIVFFSTSTQTYVHKLCICVCIHNLVNGLHRHTVNRTAKQMNDLVFNPHYSLICLIGEHF